MNTLAQTVLKTCFVCVGLVGRCKKCTYLGHKFPKTRNVMGPFGYYEMESCGCNANAIKIRDESESTIAVAAITRKGECHFIYIHVQCMCHAITMRSAHQLPITQGTAEKPWKFRNLRQSADASLSSLIFMRKPTLEKWPHTKFRESPIILNTWLRLSNKG